MQALLLKNGPSLHLAQPMCRVNSFLTFQNKFFFSYRNQASFMYFLFGAVFGALHGTVQIIFFSYQQLWVRLTLQPKIVLGVMISSGFGIGTGPVSLLSLFQCEILVI
jgi:hypothetical protein